MRTISKEELAKILERHGRWLRGEKGGACADLSGVDLRWADLTGADLYGTDLRKADLTGARLDGANLRWADLTGADLTGVRR